MSDLDRMAKAMYTQRVAERGPTWDQLGETTKDVWREYVQAEMFGDLA